MKRDIKKMKDMGNIFKINGIRVSLLLNIIVYEKNSKTIILYSHFLKFKTNIIYN